MAFTDFTSPNKVREKFNELVISKKDFIPNVITDFGIEPYLEREIKFGLKTYKPNETFADKFLIAPVINEIWQKHEKLNIWTQPYIKFDEVLNGRPDYLISPLDREQYEVLSLPIVVLVEAKQENFTAGWGQCFAEMLACQKLNKTKDVIIYGIVSTGHFWEFGKLQNDVLIRDTKSYSITNLKDTINTVNYIFDVAEKEIPKLDLSIIMENIDRQNDKSA